MVFPPDALAAEQIRYVIGETVYVARTRLIADAVGRAVVQRRLELEGVDPARVTTLTRLPQLRALVLNEEGEFERDLVGALVLLTLFIAVLYIMLNVYGHALGQSVLTEKTGKTAEIMLSSLPPFALLAGKLLGKVLAGVLQCLAWLVISLLVVAALGSHLDLTAAPFLQPANLLALTGFFVLGFLLYAAPYAIAGAIATDGDSPVARVRLQLLDSSVARVRLRAGAVYAGADTAHRPRHSACGCPVADPVHRPDVHAHAGGVG